MTPRTARCRVGRSVTERATVASAKHEFRSPRPTSSSPPHTFSCSVFRANAETTFLKAEYVEVLVEYKAERSRLEGRFFSPDLELQQ